MVSKNTTHMMKHTRILTALALLALPIVASAHPDPNNAPKGDNPTNWAARGGRGRQQLQNMTPEQRKALMRETLKRQLTRVKVTDETQQNAVADYVIGEAEARQKSEEATRALQTGLRGTTATDAQVAGLLNDYNAAMADEKARHQKALDTLKAAVDVTQFPRLEAMLTLAGLYGDAPAPAGSLASLLGAGARGQRWTQDAGGAGVVAPEMNDNPRIGGARGNMLNNRRNNDRPVF